MAISTKNTTSNDNSQEIKTNQTSQTWQKQLSDTVDNIHELFEYLNIDLDRNNFKELNLNLTPDFPIKIPKYYLNKIKNNITNKYSNLNSNNIYKDPLLLQILPIDKKINNKFPNLLDPLSENKFIKTPGLIHKYANRILLTLTGTCAIHCRYCFRQNFPYAENIISNKNRDQQLDYIKSNNKISEIILSGGDPLCVNNKYLDNLFHQLSSIDHINTIRIHSRMPTVIPDRIDSEIINIFNKYQKLNNLKFIIVTHCNHPDELDNNIKNKMALLRQNNITLLNQTVLLNYINNSPETLIELSNKLFACNIMPYYLHLLDPVKGASYFDVDLDKAKNIMSVVKANLSGYLVPKLVKEIPGEPNKTIIM